MSKLSTYFHDASFFLLILLQLENATDLEDDLDELLQEFEMRSERDILHSVCFY